MTSKKPNGIISGAASGPAAEPSVSSKDRRILQRKIRAAQRTLGFETLWPRLWLPIGVAGVFILLSAFEIWQLLAPRVHLALLWAFGFALAASIVPLVRWRKPTEEQALTRLEKASELGHRPLTAYQDTLSTESRSPETEALWQAHRARMAALLDKMKAGAPHARIDRHDPLALRLALILMLAVVGAWQWTELGTRVNAAFKVPEIASGSDYRLDVWVTPPAYTRREPIVLANGSLWNSPAKDAVAVPEGSSIAVKINGADAHSYDVSLQNGAAKQMLSPSAQSTETYAEYSLKIEGAEVLSLKRHYGSERRWQLNVVADQPPKIAFSGPIEVSQRATMLLKYKVEDDYGVIAAEAHVDRELPDRQEGAPVNPLIGKPPVFALSLPHTPTKAADAKTYKDLTAHPWAGLPVTLTLFAKDEAGHESRSAPRGIILPARKFTKALARAVVDQRRTLVENPSNTAAIAQNLNALAVAAEDEGLAAPIYLSLRSVYWRLKSVTSQEDLEGIVAQLWDIAVRIEDGNLPEAERELRAAQDRLKEALERGASQEEIQKLMNELRQALNNFLQAMAQKSQNNNNNSASSKDGKTITPQELQQLLNKIESLAKSGSQDAAQQMLNELRDVLESLQAKQGGSETDEQDAQGMQQLDKLSDLMRQQQQLLDKTFRAQQEGDESNGDEGEANGRPQQQPGMEGQPGQKGGRGAKPAPSGEKSASKLRDQQNDIKRQLQELMSGMPGQKGNPAQQKLKDAEQSMGEAGESLKEGELGQAGDQETRALENLRQGTRAMAEQMMKAAGGKGGQGQPNRDPMGRKPGGDQLGDSDDNVKVPDEITMQRAREILDELRKKLGQPSRPPAELDYLERLIKRF